MRTLPAPRSNPSYTISRVIPLDTWRSWSQVKRSVIDLVTQQAHLAAGQWQPSRVWLIVVPGVLPLPRHCQGQDKEAITELHDWLAQRGILHMIGMGRGTNHKLLIG